MSGQRTYLIIGLGNPGREYRNTRHNIGFMLLDELALKLSTTFTHVQSRALVADCHYMESKIILAKPQTFMNLSGKSVQGLIHFYNLPLGNLLIAHDDLDLPVGTIRIRPDGGSAGQKGMSSTIEHLGTNEFPRLRLGIGRPPGRMLVHDYVLEHFTGNELMVMAQTLGIAVEAALKWVSDGLDAAMNKYNGTII